MKCWTRPDPYLTLPELMALLLLSVTSLKSERSSNSANCGEQKEISTSSPQRFPSIPLTQLSSARGFLPKLKIGLAIIGA